MADNEVAFEGEDHEVAGRAQIGVHAAGMDRLVEDIGAMLAKVCSSPACMRFKVTLMVSA
jgi:hypothetical protein